MTMMMGLVGPSLVRRWNDHHNQLLLGHADVGLHCCC